MPRWTRLRLLTELYGRTDLTYLVVSVLVCGALLSGADLMLARWPAATPTTTMGLLTALPLTAFPMYTRLGLGLGAVLWQVAALGLLAAWVPSALPAPGLQIATGGLVGGVLVSASTRRGAVGAAGLWAGLASAIVFVVAGRTTLDTPALLAGTAGSIMSGALSGALVLTISPLGERLFRHVTTLSLLESLSYDHPLLRQLMTATPGTFLHATNVAVLSDAAAKAIGVDALGVRVGALYHDIGKTRAPAYFVENQDDDNPHDRLAPDESAAILRAHVTDGVALVERYGLGPRVSPFVREHHGTSLMRSLRAKPGASTMPEALFRYPGPRPRSRATGLLMIADQVEATARAVQPDSLEACRDLVRDTIDRIDGEEQLAESGLTEADRAAIVRSVADVVHAIYHRRLAYPQAAAVPAGASRR